MKKYTLLIVTLLVMTSCNVTRTSTAKSLDIHGIAMHIPVVADLNVKQEKVSASIEFQGSVTKALKDRVIAEALKKSNSDILIEPNFEIEKGVSSKITVTGFPASYKNFRNATKEDLELLKIGIIQKSKKSEGLFIK